MPMTFYATEPKGAILVAALTDTHGHPNVSVDALHYILHGPAHNKGGKKVATFPHRGVYSDTIVPIMAIEKGMVTGVSDPANDFYHAKDDDGRDVIVFSGIEPEKEWEGYARGVADAARHFDIRMMYVLGSVHESMPHTREPLFYGVFADPKFSGLQGFDFPSYKGPLRTSALLVAEAQKSGTDALGIVVRLPNYLLRDNPKGKGALLKRLAEHSGLSFDLKPLDEAVRLFDEEMGRSMKFAPREAAETVRALEEAYDSRVNVPRGLQEFLRGLDLGGLGSKGEE